MPKREPTPPPADDEPKYLTVFHPYPTHANMELEQDRKYFAFWLACIMGQKNLFAFFHKPSSPNMVIIEVNKEFDGFTRLLGAHYWREFLKEPKPDEVARESRIFYCTLNTGRQVQKYGWKRVEVQDAWFKKARWNAQNRFVEYPYPASHRCERPAEDLTNEPLCRPLPVQYFPPPPPPVKSPPVGSPAWVDSKKAPANAWAKKSPAVTNAWTKGAPSITIPNNNSSSNSNSKLLSPSAGVSPSVVSSERDANLWGLSPISKSSSNDGSVYSPSPLSPSPVPSFPPGLGPKITRPPNIATMGPPGLSIDQGPPGLVRSPINQGAYASSTSNTSSDNDEDISLYLPPSAGGANAYFGPDERSLKALSIDDDDMSAYATSWESRVVDEHTDAVAQGNGGAPVGSLWDGYDDKLREPLSTEPLCPTHGKTCGKGICSDRAKMNRKAEQEARGRGRVRRGVERGRDRGVPQRGRTQASSNRNGTSEGGKNSNGNSERRSEVGDAKSIASDGDDWGGASPVDETESLAEGPAVDWLAIKPVGNWADDVAADEDGFSTVSTTKGSKRRPASRAASAAVSTASGWGNVSEGPW